MKCTKTCKRTTQIVGQGRIFFCIFSLNKLFEAKYKQLITTTGDEYVDVYHVLYFGLKCFKI